MWQLYPCLGGGSWFCLQEVTATAPICKPCCSQTVRGSRIGPCREIVCCAPSAFSFGLFFQETTNFT